MKRSAYNIKQGFAFLAALSLLLPIVVLSTTLIGMTIYSKLSGQGRPEKYKDGVNVR